MFVSPYIGNSWNLDFNGRKRPFRVISHEWSTHCRKALSNVCRVEEIRAARKMVGIYAGVPVAVERIWLALVMLEKAGKL